MKKSPIKYIIIFIIRFYKILLSPLFFQSCRFFPTCSSYAISAIEKHGIVVGLYFTILRLISCNPFCKKTGYDPVP